MKFTEEEKMSMLKAMDSLIKVDNHIDDKEVEFLEVMVEEFDWDNKFLAKLDSFQEEDALKAIRNLSPEKLNYFQTMLSELANSDNDINQDELNYIEHLNEYITSHTV